MKNNVPVITIDGPAGSGKGTMSALLARKLGWHYLDSGALYRILGWAVLQHSIDIDDLQALKNLLAETQPDLRETNEQCRYYCNDRDITEEIRAEAVGEMTSKISKIPYVREFLLQRQRDWRKPPGLVTDGRDMGTVVFPDADLKLYLDADFRERAKRRFRQLKSKGIDVSLPAIEQDLLRRDQRDQNREIAPAKPARDVVRIDTTMLSVDEVLNEVFDCVTKSLGL